MIGLQPSQFVLEPEFTRTLFYQQAAVPFIDLVTGDIDFDKAKAAFDEVFATAALAIKQIVDAVDGSETDMEEAFEAFRQSVEAAFRPMQ